MRVRLSAIRFIYFAYTYIFNLKGVRISNPFVINLTGRSTSSSFITEYKFYINGLSRHYLSELDEYFVYFYN